MHRVLASATRDVGAFERIKVPKPVVVGRRSVVNVRVKAVDHGCIRAGVIDIQDSPTAHRYRVPASSNSLHDNVVLDDRILHGFYAHIVLRLYCADPVVVVG
jgi:hypothetical protein